jgi:DNA-binding LytR/AlgR family response regulator
MKVLIVDDEPLAQDILETYISNLPHLELVKKCNNAIEALQVLNTEHIDLIFLDIQMPQLSGIDFVKTLTNNKPMIIFTTAYSEYALEGFEHDAIDYLLKPISLDRFLKAVNKAQEQYQLSSKQSNQSETDDYFFVKADKKFVKVNFNEIIYIEGLKDYVMIKMDTQRVITLQTMKSLEEKLPNDRFVRIHRSFIVNLNRINAILGNVVEVMEKGQQKHLPIGKNHKDELVELIEKHKL